MTLPLGLGVVRVASPAVLVALVALPLVFLGARSRKAVLAAGLRALAAAALILSLAGLYGESMRPERGVCIVAAIDVSASVQRAGVEAARAFLRQLVPALGPDDLLGAVVFAADAEVLARPSVRPPLARLLPPSEIALETGETDLAAALGRAAPLCPGEKQTALLLFTDGNETEGSLLAEAVLTEPRVPIYPIVPPSAALPPVAIRRVLAPTFAPENTVLPLEIVVENRSPARLTGAVRLTATGRPGPEEPAGKSARLHFVDLPPGVSVVPLPYRLVGPGQYLLEAELLPRPGLPPSPGPAHAAITVTRPIGALIVSQRATPVVATALADRGMHVEVVPPGELGARLRDHHLVVLDDVGRSGLSDAALAALADYVAGGGALVASGGQHLFGDPGFVGTPLERILPVELQSQTPEPKEREPIALELVIDRSNSMGYSSGPALGYGAKMEYAKRASLAVLDQLGTSDLVGAIAFDSQPYEIAPLVPLGEGGAALATRIRQLQYGGGTDFKEALDIARRHLLASGRRVRHVILLTDGDTNRRAADHDELIAALARDDVTVTTIRIGDDTVNLDLLNKISAGTGGQFHHAENVQVLPQLMISDARRFMDAAAGRRGARARIGEAGPLLAGLAEEDLPPVARWAITRPKPGAEIRLWVDTGERREPILATWQYELGRTAVVPLDFQAGAAAWAAWPGFEKLWAQLALWAIPPGLASDRHLEARRLRTGVLVRLTTLADEPGPFVLRLPPGPGDVPLRPSGRRAFSAIVPDLAAGVHPAVLRVGSGEEPLDVVVPASSPSGREYRSGAPNLALLERVAALTGGHVAPEPAAVLAARPGVRRRMRALETVLVPLALVLLLGDIAARRLIR